MKKKDEDAFLSSIRGTTEIIKNNKVEKKIPKTSKIFLEKKIIKNTFIEENIIERKITKSLHFEIQTNSINKKLKKGKIPINKRVDFHGHGLESAESLFIDTISLAIKDNESQAKKVLLVVIVAVN